MLDTNNPPAVSEQDDRSTELTRIASPRTEEEWAEVIRPDLAAGAAFYIGAGRKFLQAKAALKKTNGSFVHLVTVLLGCDLDTVERWMEIARHPVISDSATSRNLPTAWTTLHQLARIPPELLFKYIADGSVHPQLTYSGAVSLSRGGSTGGRVRFVPPPPSKPERCTSLSGAGDLWAHLREAIEHLGSLPCPRDTVDQVRKLSPRVARIIDQRLPGLVKWLVEFLNEWNSRNGQQQKSDAAGDDVGPNSTGETDRLQARVSELEHEQRRMEIENVGLRCEIEELKAPRPLTTNPINSEATRH
jgi:hypothetical protein